MNPRTLASLTALTLCACGQDAGDAMPWWLSGEDGGRVEITTPAPAEMEPSKPTPEVVAPERTPPVVDTELPALPDPEACDTTHVRSADVTEGMYDDPVLTETFGEDGCLDEQWRYERDALGRTTREQYRYFDPSLAENVYVVPRMYVRDVTWGAHGDEPTEEVFSDFDTERMYMHTTRTFDAQGRLVERTQAGAPWAGEEALGRATREGWRYDGRGNQTRHWREYDGEVRDIERTLYDAQGRPLEVWRDHGQGPWLADVTRWDDAERTSTHEHYERPDARTSTTQTRYDEAGEVRERVRDHHRNGWLDIERFDAQGRKVFFSQDEDQDGRVEYEQVWRFDDTGLELYHHTYYDYDRAGQPQRGKRISRTFDDLGRPLEVTGQDHTYNASRSPSYRVVDWSHRYAYDDGARVEERRVREDGGAWRLEQRITRDAQDRVISVHTDRDGDGTLDRRVETRYDRHGEVAQVVTTSQNVTSRERWHRDARGRLLRHTVDYQDDGVFERRIEHRY